MLVDSHAHLNDAQFDADLDEVIKRTENNGVEMIIDVAESLTSAPKAIELGRRYRLLVTAVGSHPHLALDFSELTKSQLRSLAQTENVVALGETGLDLYRSTSSLEAQEQAFLAQIELAKELNLPLIIHCRKAYQRLINILSEHGQEAKGVVHCFSGTMQHAQEILAIGFYIGIAGPITFPKNDELKSIVRKIPLNRVLIETDSPYLAPQPKRGKRNEPAYVKYVAEEIARLKELTVADVARVTRYNAIKLFELPLKMTPQIAYTIRNNLYLNITNRCSNNCLFCHRTSDYVVKGHYLKLPEEPSLNEIIEAIEQVSHGKITQYDEIVFCGLGEPTFRLDVLKQVAQYLRQKGVKRIRLNTNGQARLIHGKDILPELAGLIDTASISLNAPDKAQYNQLCQPEDPDRAFPAVIEFIKEAKKVIPEVLVSIVDYPGLDKLKCQQLAQAELGVKLRIREFVAHYT